MNKVMTRLELDTMLSNLNVNLSANLRRLRLRKGISQEKLAEILRISRTSYNRIEKGRVCPDLATVCAILHYFEIPLEYLVSDRLEDHVYYADCTWYSSY